MKNKMKNKKILALTLGLSLAVGSLTGSYGIAQANQKPAGIEHMQMDHERPMHNKANQQEMLTLLQIDEQTFRQEQNSGKSLAEIALAHNVSRQAVVDLVVKNMNQQIDKRLADKRITAEQATDMKTTAVEKAQKMVDGQRMGPMGSHKMHNRSISPEMLTLLQIDEQTFRQEQRSGKSLVEIGIAHNVSRQAIIDLVVKDVNQQIDQGIVDERITAEQATAMKTNVVEKAQTMVDGPLMGPMGPHKMNNRPISPAMLTLLQIDEQTFRQEQNSGKSLVEIGLAHNVSRQAIVDLVVKDMSQQIDKGVADKRITAEQAAVMKSNAVEKAQKIVDGQPSDKMHNRRNPITQELLTLLKVDAQTFEQEQRSGKSLAEIGSVHNVSRQAVVDLVVKNMNQQIDKGVVDKRITAEQATEMRTNAVAEAQKMVDKNMMEQPVHIQR